MPSISYNVVDGANLSLKRLPLKQIEVIIDITGGQVDPLSLQQIRDEPSLRQCFLDRRTNINRLIQSTAADLAKITDDKKGQARVDLFNKELEKEIGTLEKELQIRANAFVLKQKKQVNDLFWAQARLAVRVIWAFAKFVKSNAEIGGKVVAASTAGATMVGAFLSVVAVKSLMSAWDDCGKAFDELESAMEGEQQQFVKLKAAVLELKKLKKPAPVPQSKIDAVGNLLGPYGARLLGVDAAAKKTAGELDSLLKELDKGKMRRKAVQEEMENKIDGLIHQIIERSKNVAEGRKLLQAAKDKVKDASGRAQKDPTSFWGVSAYFWKAVDYMVEIGEVGVTSKLTFGNVWAAMKPKLQDELKDAYIEEQTKL